MQANEKKIWFPAKKYGWGWGLPCSWQGWIVFAAWLAVIGGGGVFLAPRSVGLYVFVAVASSVILVVIAFIKGEPPRWRWGEEEPPPARSSADRLVELEELRRRRLITEAEYQARRGEILKEI